MRSESLRMNCAVWVMIPSTFCSSVTLVGLGSDFISSTFWVSGCISFMSKIAPKNLTCFWLIVHLSLLNVRHAVCVVSINFHKLWSCSSLIFLWTITSSINSKAPVHFSIIMFILCWKTSKDINQSKEHSLETISSKR